MYLYGCQTCCGILELSGVSNYCPRDFHKILTSEPFNVNVRCQVFAYMPEEGVYLTAKKRMLESGWIDSGLDLQRNKDHYGTRQLNLLVFKITKESVENLLKVD